MFTVRDWRLSFLVVGAFALVLGLGACSKKDVVEDEPAFGASGDGSTEESSLEESSSSAATPAPPPVEESVGTAGAGDISVPSSDFKTAYFDFDSFSLRADAREALKSNAQWLKDNPSAKVQIEGHCDERGTTEYNLALGEKRANAVREYLKRLGVSSGRLTVISYGEERPSDPGHDESAWSQNRRATFIVLSQ